jgi:hypothetical protein
MASSPASYGERLGVGAAVAPGVGLEDLVGDGVAVTVGLGVRGDEDHEGRAGG